MQGVYEKVNNLKISKLEDETFLKVLKKFDILCLQETHLGENDIPDVPDDYVPIPHCRNMSGNKRYFGGMVLLVRKSIRGLITIHKDFDQDTIEVHLKKKSFYLKQDKRIIFAYASPFNSSYTKSREMNILEKLETKDACCQDTLLMGDLNGRTKNEEDYVRDHEDKHCPADTPMYTRDLILRRNNLDVNPVDQQGKLILNLCKSNGLRILNGRSFGDRNGHLTRYPLDKNTEKPSTIDYALCGQSFLADIFSFSILPFTDLSDHCCLSTTIRINRVLPKAPADENVDDYPDVSVNPKMDTFVFDPERLDIFKANIRQDENIGILASLVAQNNRPSPEDFLEGVTHINNILISAAKKSFLPKLSRKNPPKRAERKKIWYTKECASYKSLLRRYSRKLSSSPFNKKTLNQFQTCKRKYKKTCRMAEKHCRLSMIATLKKIQSTEGPKDFWNMIKKMNNWGGESKDYTDKISPKMWHKYFKDLLNSNNTNPIKGTADYPPTFEPILDGVIAKMELKSALEDLKRNKIGPDGILSNFLKVFGEMYENILLKIMNGLFTSHLYCEEWNTNYLKPIYKKGDILDPDNYRGIAIGSAFAKLHSLILLNRLIKFIDDKGLISPNQIGFMKFCRTADHNFLLQTLIEKTKKSKKKLYVAFIDFKKAYDTVNRALLFERLRQLGINGLFYRNILEMYKNTKYSIKMKDGCLEPIMSNLGLRQGCPLSPMLFNLFIDDVSDIFLNTVGNDPVHLQGKEISHFLYADDLVLVSESAEGLQNCLDKLGVYAEQKSLTVNINKSKTMIFNSSGRFIKESFHIKGKRLEPVDAFCYLGFEVKPSGTTTHGSSILLDKSLKALRPLQRAIANFQLPLDLSIKLFHTLIEPIAMYNVENWSILTKKQLENLNADTMSDFIDKSALDTMHRKLLRYILGVNNSSPNLALYGDTGEIPLTIKGFTLMVNFWHHVNELPETSFASLALKENIEIRTNWIKTIEKIINIFNLAQHVDSPTFRFTSKKIGRDFYRAKWEEVIRGCDYSRLNFYKQIKTDWAPASYTNLPYHQRKVIAKLRCSSHSLEIEKGRHKRPMPIAQDRLCILCQEAAIENETHFLSACEKYSTLRIKHGYAMKTPHEIINEEDQKNLSIFLSKCFRLRQKTLDGNSA